MLIRYLLGQSQLEAAKKVVDQVKTSSSNDLQLDPATVSDMSEDHWTALIDHITKKLPDLKSLDISNIGIKRLPDNIKKLTQLEYLGISGNLSDLGAGFQLPKLKTLCLCNCNFTRVPSSVLRLAALDRLDMSGNKLGKLDSSVFKIRSVGLEDCGITEIVGKQEKINKKHVIQLRGDHTKELGNRLSKFPEHLYPALKNAETRIGLNPYKDPKNIAEICSILAESRGRVHSIPKRLRKEYDAYFPLAKDVPDAKYLSFLALRNLLSIDVGLFSKDSIHYKYVLRAALRKLGLSPYMEKAIEKPETQKRSAAAGPSAGRSVEALKLTGKQSVRKVI